MNRATWFIKIWVWDSAKGEYEPLLRGFDSESEARKLFRTITITNNMPCAELIDDLNKDFKVVEIKEKEETKNENEEGLHLGVSGWQEAG